MEETVLALLLFFQPEITHLAIMLTITTLNARETITVAAVHQGDLIESFSTPGAAILTAAYGSGI